jgi:hypothetical protein
VTSWPLALALAALAAYGHESNAGSLPVCANRVINQVVKRSGCTLGDARCWYRSGGFCTDYVERRLGKERVARAAPIDPATVKKGDVAVFASRVHMSLVEAVVRDGQGRPVAVDLGEFNFGTCWVDAESMVTDQYKLLNRRRGVAISDVDGGFLRAPATAR